MAKLEFHNHEILPDSDTLTERLTELRVDADNWRIYLTDRTNNFIKFYPYSEYHGGGAPYFINIGTTDFASWISEHPNFEQEIRIMLDK